MEDVIPLFDPKLAHHEYVDELKAAQNRVFEDGRFIGGEQVEAFEEELAKAQGCRYAVSCGSGTDAIALALIATGCGGSTVAIPALTFVGTRSGAIRAGCRTVLCDVDDEGLLDPEKIPDECDCALPVALYGNEPPLIRDTEVVDGCQSSRDHGGGNATAISFFPTKPLGGFGDGGAVLTDDPAVAEAMRVLRQHGRSLTSGELVRAGGWNSRLDAVQAAMLRVVLLHRERADGLRKLYAERYDAVLEPLEDFAPLVRAGPHTYRAMYPILMPPQLRQRVQETLWAHGVEAPAYYPRALSESFHGYRRCPNAEILAHGNLCLPLFPHMPDSVFERVDAALREVLG